MSITLLFYPNSNRIDLLNSHMEERVQVGFLMIFFQRFISL